MFSWYFDLPQEVLALADKSITQKGPFQHLILEEMKRPWRIWPKLGDARRVRVLVLDVPYPVEVHKKGAHPKFGNL